MKGAAPVPVLSRYRRLPGFRSCSTSVPVGLRLDQHLIAHADVLQARGQRAVGHLDAQELQVLLVIGAGDAVGAQQRAVTDVQTQHHELPVLEAQALIARGGEGELSIGPMMDPEHSFAADRRQDGIACCRFEG